jgi:hypothetical protein
MSTDGGIGLLPSNETFAPTQANGTGSADFDVWTSAVDQDLGCQAGAPGVQAVPCALVAVPVMGVSCDTTAAGETQADISACEETGFFGPGQPASSTQIPDGELSVEGGLWWAASNWRNRFTVPLSFNPNPGICSIVNKSNRLVQTYGSDLLEQAQAQWEPHFCLDASNPFTENYVNEAEPSAANDLATGQIEAALVSDQPSAGFPEPVVHAPVAATGFAISFVIDNPAGNQVMTLNLDARLLAKLLTESYPGNSIGNTDPELLHQCFGPKQYQITVPGTDVNGTEECTNPLDITQDPEFQALNPGIGTADDTETASVLLSLSTQSDVIHALTSYINADTAARAWLNGAPDPWGMVVNQQYAGIQLPVSSWPLRSDYDPPSWVSGDTAFENNPCYSNNPSPVLNLIADPGPDLPTIAEDLQFSLDQPELTCSEPNGVPFQDDTVLTANPPQTVGFRFMLALTSLGDAERYDLPTASLMSYSAPGSPENEGLPFTSSAGMTFVPPTNASLSDAAALLTADDTQDDWDFPYSLYGQDSPEAEQAYPGTMLVYADIPTQGLPAADASEYASFLDYVAGPGQDPGTGIGQLAPGYLPMTAADNLCTEDAYTVEAAAAVAAQKGTVPDLPSSCPTPGSGFGAGSTGAGGPGSVLGLSGGAGSGKTALNHAKPGSTTVPLPHSRPAAQVALTPGQAFGIAAYVLLGVAGLAVLGGLAAAMVSVVPRLGGKKGFAVAALASRLSWLREKKWD